MIYRDARRYAALRYRDVRLGLLYEEYKVWENGIGLSGDWLKK